MSTFAWTEENATKAEGHVAKYPEGKQQSAVMPLLDIAQRQNGGHLTSDVIEFVADYLSMPAVRVLEVATFYTMYNHKPVGKYHLQVCGTTPCWLRGAGELMDACKDHLGVKNGGSTEDGLFTLTEVECLGACVNAPILQVNDDYYEDVSPERAVEILEALKRGDAVPAGPQIKRLNSAPEGGQTTLTESEGA